MSLDVWPMVVATFLFAGILTASGTIFARRGVSASTICYLYSVVVSLFYVLGLWHYVSASGVVVGSLDIPGTYYQLDEIAFAASIHVSIVIVVAMLVGGVIERDVTVDRAAAQSAVARIAAPLVFVSCAILLLAVLTFGVQDLVFRSTYQVVHASVLSQSAQGLGESLSMLGPISLGVAFFSGPGRAIRVACIVTLFCFLLFYLGTTTRFVAVAPLAFVVCRLLFKKPTPGYLVSLLAVAVVSAPLFALPLASRTTAAQGILPGLSVLGDPAFLVGVLESVPDNLLSPIWIAAATLSKVGGIGQLDQVGFWVSVNPAPGVQAGWYDLADWLRINDFVPFNVVGELAGYGWLNLIGFSLCMGVAFGLMGRAVARRSSRVVLMVVVGFVFLASIVSLQYNLRSAWRQVVYAAVVLWVIFPMVAYLRRVRFR